LRRRTHERRPTRIIDFHSMNAADTWRNPTRRSLFREQEAVSVARDQNLTWP
jgi:hypothetical protein